MNNIVLSCYLSTITDEAKVSGWGRHIWRGSNGLPKNLGNSQSLMVAQVPLQSHESCIEKVKNLPYNITENMMCAGEDGPDACEGDSGGPLTCTRNMTSGEDEPYLCGIVSWGTSCYRSARQRVEQYYPGVYTDVTKYAGWIEKFMRTWEMHYWSNTESLIPV